jgi:dihydrofolate reductase
MRPHVSVYLGVSLDLRIAHADGTLDFLTPYQQSGEDYGYAAFMADIDAVILGRQTFESIRGFEGPWPFGDRRVVVLTHRALPEVPAAVHAHAGPLSPLLEAMGAEGIRHVYLDGGDAVRHGLREGVVDALTLSVVPEVLGAGRPLFDETVPRSHWRLESSAAYPSGLVQIRYRRGDHATVTPA